MPRHKKRLTGPRFWQKQKVRGKGYEFDFGMKEETRKEAVALVMLILAVLMVLSIFGKAGVFGSYIMEQSLVLLGYLAYTLPILFIAIVASAINSAWYEIRLSTVIGYLLFYLSFGGLIHIIMAGDTPLALARSGGGGGLIGYLGMTMFTQVVGSVGAFIVLVALFLLSLSMAFNTSLMNMWSALLRGDEDSDGGRININEGGSRVSVFTTVKRGLGGFGFRRRKEAMQTKAPVMEVKPIGALKSATDGSWTPPPIDLLETSDSKANPGNIQKNAEIIAKTLKEFGIEVAMQDVNVGPTVSQYTFKPTEGVKLSNITARSNDLALSLAAKSLRMEAPIPGQSAVGVEIPNKQTAKVTLREILESEEYRSGKGKLNIPLGRDVAGKPIIIDLEGMPHLLIAGATGSGKSVAINAIIVSYIMNNSPQDLKFILVDPKRVELTGYNGIPHLLSPVITDTEKTVSALKWAVAEMEGRYHDFAELGHRNLASYNQKPGPKGHLSHIVIIIDELADLMATASNDVEGSIVRLAQMARAVGIHLIVATQRPSVDVITGLIKANIPCRIAFTVASQVDSRTIIDLAGAEKLLGMGDMLYLGGDITKPKRIQGCFVGDKEISGICDFLKKDSFVKYVDEVTTYHPAGHGGVGGVGGDGPVDDDLYREAVSVVTQAGKASSSMLMRRLRVGYARSARLLDMLEQEGVIGPPDGSKPREVFMNPSELTDRNDQQY